MRDERAAGNPSDGSDAGSTSQVFDVVVAGGGPGGTAAAFRAHELGLSALVLEYDDLMKRIRDYSKDKLILPGFGGGDKMKFPKGGDLIGSLHFAPIDKDEMCAQFKAAYAEHQIPVRIGCEFTGLRSRSDGHYDVLGWDHRERRDLCYRARHVVLALGRGVPRRFDIPGNCEGICYRLEEADSFVGAPACVIGGGTSAAEAVIAISNAKAMARDPTAVYWSYRGDRMPRVSKALAEVFFEAYVGNGNILYFPKSEPAAIVTTEEREDFLSLRVDRRTIAGRPNETTYLEFGKENCIACIGEDIPAGLLAGVGIHMRQTETTRKRMMVNHFLESELPNVFLVGDLLSPGYFVSEAFDLESPELREIKHRGNIKSALRDGVLVAEVIKQRTEGRSSIEVHIEDADDPEHAASQVVALTRPVETREPAAIEEAAVAAEPEALLVRLLPGGVEEGEHPLRRSSVTTIGREDCDLSFASDTMLSERHASIAHQDDGYYLRDDGSKTGVFLRIPAAKKRRLVAGDLVRAGRQFLLFSQAEGGFVLTHYDARGQEIGRHELPDQNLLVGRQCPDLNLDPHDTTLSRRQLALTVEAGELFIKDLKSANGTYLRVKSPTRLEHGDQIRFGQQTLVFSNRADAVLDTGNQIPPPAPELLPPPPSEKVTDGGAASVTFGDGGQPLVAKPGQTICELAEAHGVPITAECHAGICGSDPIRILSGHEHLDAEAGDQERETLEEICELKPGDCRLACMVRARGPIKVEILKD